MLSKDNIKTYIKQWLATANNVQVSEIDASSSLFGQGMLNSLNTYNLIADIELEFRISFKEDDLIDTRITTIVGITELVEEISGR